MNIPRTLCPALLILLTACGRQAPVFSSPTPLPVDTQIAAASPQPALIASATPTQTASPLPSPASTITPTPTASPTPTVTPTPTITPTPPQTLTPTFDFPDVIVQMQANCRYGPGTAYLYSHGLYPGDTGIVGGRNASGTWLWIMPNTLNRYCWVSASVVQVIGDIFTVRAINPPLPFSTFYYPPKNVQAERQGSKVIVTWKRVPMTEDDDRGYLIEANLCQNGDLVWGAYQTEKISYTFTDEPGCKEKSNARIFTVDKHGYSDPEKIPWPKPS